MDHPDANKGHPGHRQTSRANTTVPRKMPAERSNTPTSINNNQEAREQDDDKQAASSAVPLDLQKAIEALNGHVIYGKMNINGVGLIGSVGKNTEDNQRHLILMDQSAIKFGVIGSMSERTVEKICSLSPANAEQPAQSLRD